ncbi:hypothetical protein O181_040311 [Austropuccinia psidii MF-1]|uniref:Uncharacterized protein n=1 Tax=Austropuccinia psidii MF-1 TaxID=1389203 RepID=A0A9Q3DB52_9BASI|nr:hypothetical protein [Austropuccinia psidii MF-1]
MGILTSSHWRWLVTLLIGVLVDTDPVLLDVVVLVHSPLSNPGLGHNIMNEDNDRRENSNAYLLTPINPNLYAQSLPSTHASAIQIYTPCTHASYSQIYTQIPVENSRISGVLKTT